MAQLKAKLSADDHGKLDAAIQAFYTKAGDGSYTLDVEENGALRTALASERTAREASEKNARDLSAALEKFKGITDPQKALDAISQLEKLDTEKLLKEGKLDQVIAQATAKITSTKDGEIKALMEKQAAAEKAAQEAMAYATRMAIEREVAVTAPDAKVKASAIGDVVGRAGTTWRLEQIEGTNQRRLVPYQEDGKSILFGKTPPKPVEMKEWIAGLEETFPHYFEGSGGSGNTPPGAPKVQGANGSEVVLTSEQARDVSTFRAAKAQAEKAGVPLRIA